MRVPFERLVEQVAALSAEDQEMSMGNLAEQLGVTTERLADAIDALKMLADPVPGGLVIRSGDKLVLCVADRIDAARAARLKDLAGAQLPGLPGRHRRLR